MFPMRPSSHASFQHNMLNAALWVSLLPLRFLYRNALVIIQAGRTVLRPLWDWIHYDWDTHTHTGTLDRE